MRLSQRTLSQRVAIAVLAAALSACSSMRSMAPSVVPAGQDPAATTRKALSLSAFPSSIDAWPSSLGAFPSTLSAFAACQTQSNQAQCHSQWRSDITVNPNAFTPASQIQGFQPNDLQNAYDVPWHAANEGGDQTIGIVVAYHDPNLSTALNVYRATFGLQKCTSNNGCLTVVWGNSGSGNGWGGNGWGGPGNGNTPSFNQGWAIEEELDVEMASAICPNCNILVSEAADAELQNLASAVTLAVNQGATEVSNSYSVPETPDMAQYASAYKANGVPMTVSAGDRGFGPGFPATLSTVTAVGGASLVNSNGNWGEAVWPGTGSGCSTFVQKPSWQSDTGCSNRTVNDVAVVADPGTGVAAYVPYVGGWAVFGGTSVGAPIVAGLYALAENGAYVNNPSILYKHANAFAPVTSRANGTCYPNYLCSGGPGYDGPSGLGMPIGVGAF